MKYFSHGQIENRKYPDHDGQPLREKDQAVGESMGGSREEVGSRIRKTDK